MHKALLNRVSQIPNLNLYRRGEYIRIMYDRRLKNEEIFKDTEYCYTTIKDLKDVVKESIENQRFIPATEILSIIVKDDLRRDGKVIVSGKRTLEASEVYSKMGKKVGILNFASATNPGGGVVQGSSAQEESICRCSTLYPCLNDKNMWDNFYFPHRREHNPLNNDDCIFTPNVMVFKSDIDFPAFVDREEWWKVDVITIAAPNLRTNPSNMFNPYSGAEKADISEDDLRVLLEKRIRRVFEVAIKEEIEVLILGAFGCGAFRNPPHIVSDVFAQMTKEYRKCFDVIEYAVYHTEYETKNYKAFKRAMEQFE